jgi:hypothetical protein
MALMTSLPPLARFFRASTTGFQAGVVSMMASSFSGTASSVWPAQTAPSPLANSRSVDSGPRFRSHIIVLSSWRGHSPTEIDFFEEPLNAVCLIIPMAVTSFWITEEKRWGLLLPLAGGYMGKEQALGNLVYFLMKDFCYFEIVAGSKLTSRVLALIQAFGDRINSMRRHDEGHRLYHRLCRDRSHHQPPEFNLCRRQINVRLASVIKSF